MFLRMIQWLRSLYPRQISSFCFGFCWALPRSLLLRCFALWRNANLAGGFAGRFWLRFCFVWFVFRDDLPEFLDHTCPIYTLLLFTAYAIVRTVPSANRPNRREKKGSSATTLIVYPCNSSSNARLNPGAFLSVNLTLVNRLSLQPLKNSMGTRKGNLHIRSA